MLLPTKTTRAAHAPNARGSSQPLFVRRQSAPYRCSPSMNRASGSSPSTLSRRRSASTLLRMKSNPSLLLSVEVWPNSRCAYRSLPPDRSGVLQQEEQTVVSGSVHAYISNDRNSLLVLHPRPGSSLQGSCDCEQENYQYILDQGWKRLPGALSSLEHLSL